MLTVFIDGSQGTTGLRIHQRLSQRADIRLLALPESERKSLTARVKMAQQADATFLCLPDDAARELVDALGEGEGCILDTSTAHRTDPRFAYGFAELSEDFEQAIVRKNRIAVPGCHASGAIALLYPLVKAGLLDESYPIALTSLTGYSGGGKKMIAEYESENRDTTLDSPRPYGLTQSHKHLPEIMAVCGLKAPPIFQPVVADYYSGMLVSLPLWPRLMQGAPTMADVTAIYESAYAGKPLLQVLPPNAGETLLAANALQGRDDMQLFLTGNDERMIAVCRFDNLGKGASGAAIECLNLHFGLPAQPGLETA